MFLVFGAHFCNAIDSAFVSTPPSLSSNLSVTYVSGSHSSAIFSSCSHFSKTKQSTHSPNQYCLLPWFIQCFSDWNSNPISGYLSLFTFRVQYIFINIWVTFLFLFSLVMFWTVKRTLKWQSPLFNAFDQSATKWNSPNNDASQNVISDSMWKIFYFQSSFGLELKVYGCHFNILSVNFSIIYHTV